MSYRKIINWDSAAVLGLLLLTLAFFAKALSGQQVFFHEDLYGLFYPMKEYYVSCLQAHRLPLWNPYIGCGYPQFAEGQIAAFYPLNFLLFALLPLDLAFNYNVIIHFALAGIFFYAFLRKRGLGIEASFVGGLIFEGSAFMIAHLQHPSIFCSVAWLPLLLYFLEDGLQRAQVGKENTSRLLAAGGVLALQLLVGYPPIVFYTFLTALIYVFCRWLTLRKAGVRLRQIASLFFGALLVGLSLSAVQWLPTMELSLSSERAALTRVIFMTSFGLNPKHLPTFIFPHYLGSSAFGTYVGERYFWEVCGYLGLISFLLILPAVIKRWSRVWPWTVLGGIGLFLAVARLTSGDTFTAVINPIYYLLQYIPPFNFFRAAGRYLLLWTVAGPVLAAEGIQFLLDKSDAERKSRALPASLLLVLLLGGWIGLQLYFYRRLPAYHPRPALLPAEWAIFACGLLLFVAAWFAAHWGILKKLLAFILTAAVAVDLLAFAIPLAPVTAASFHKIVPWSARRIQQDKSWYRVWPIRASQPDDPFYDEPYPWMVTLKYYLWDKDRIRPNLNLPWRLRTVPGNAALLRALDFSVHVSESESFPAAKTGSAALLRMARLLGAKYLLLRHSDPTLELIEHRSYSEYPGGVWLYRNPEARPRAWVVGKIQVIADPVRAGEVVFGANFDPTREAVLLQALPQPLDSLEAISAEPEFEDPRPEKIIIHTKTEKSGLLVINELYDNNWEATLDGAPVPLYQANTFLRGVFLPPGEHRVTLVYNNLYFAAGLRISLAAVLLLGLVALKLLRRGSTSPPSQSNSAG